MIAATLVLTVPARGEAIGLQLRVQSETKPGSGRYHTLSRGETWQGTETAIIVCDVWDLHSSVNATRRLEEFAPRLNDVLAKARRQGATIVHAPSDTMHAYADHPSRIRASKIPRPVTFPKDIKDWCSRVANEEKVAYPIDQSDGGSDDELREHAAWAAKLQAMGRDPASPWKSESPLIEIDGERDYITDRGDEVWSILENRGIKHVILAGVHLNMCVLGRPFGLRRLVTAGKQVVLLRDLTDTMYNPARAPFVNHFTANDLMVSYVEQCICPTISSDQFLSDRPFRFKADRRPHLAIVMAETEYETERTLTAFARNHLGDAFRVSFIYASEPDRPEIPGLEILNEADIALISVRRKPLKPEQMAIVRRFVGSRKPVVGIRTASHAFHLASQPAPSGTVDWPEFDKQVFGGSYHGHHGAELKAIVSTIPEATDCFILSGVPREPFAEGGSLYKTSPLAAGATPLLLGKVEGHPAEPVAWTFLRADGTRSFYTSLGHKSDFENPAFVRLLRNALEWASGASKSAKGP
jgi:nicotinamidase-related amidase